MNKRIGFKKSMRTMLTMMGLCLLLTTGLGATVSAAPPIATAAAEMHGETGVLILSVVQDSPADRAGIARGDIVLAVDDVAVDSVATFAQAIGALAAGDEAVITVLHGDDTLELPTILGERDGRTYLGVVPYDEEAVSADEADESDANQALEEEAVDENSADSENADTAEDGAVDEADEDEGDEPTEPRSLRSMMPFSQGGAMIAEVVAGGPAAEAGLVAGDLIVAVDGQELSENVDFAELIGSYVPGDEVTLTVTNVEGNETMEVPVVLGAHPDDEERAFLGIAYVLAPSFPSMGDVAPDEDIGDDGDMPAEGDEAMEESDESGEDAAPAERGSLRSMMPFGGAMVAEVVEGGPADEAGLVAGDLIVAVDGQELSENVDFAELIGSHAPGDEVTLTVTNIETNETMEVPVVLGAHPDDDAKAFLGIAYVMAPALPGMGDVGPDDGADESDADMTEDDDGDLDDDGAVEESGEGNEDAAPRGRYERFEMPAPSRGAKVAEVVADGPAAEAGLVTGDLIVAVDGEELGAGANLGDLIGSYAPGDEVVLTIQHEDSDETLDITVVLGAHPDNAERAYLGVAYTPLMNRAWDLRDSRRNTRPAPRQHQVPQDNDQQGEELEDGDDCFHGHEGFHGRDGADNQGCEEHHSSGEHGGMMMPFFHHGMGGYGLEDLDLDQLSQEDRDALQEMFPFLFPDVEPEGESQGESGL